MKTFKQIITESAPLILSEASGKARPILKGMTVSTPDGIGIVQSVTGKGVNVFIGVSRTKKDFDAKDVKFAGFKQGNKVKDKGGVLGGVGSVIGVKMSAKGKEDIIEVRDTDRSKVEIPEDDLEFVSGF